MDNTLRTVGLAYKNRRAAAGEEPAGDACRRHDCRLLLAACDAAENTLRRIRHFAEAGQCPVAETPWTKEEMGWAVGRASCAMIAVTDLGFARLIAGKLAEADPEKYGETARELAWRAERAARRRAEQREKDRQSARGPGGPRKKK